MITLNSTEKYAIAECEREGTISIDKEHIRIYENLISNGILEKMNVGFETTNKVVLRLTSSYKHKING